jgi:hypothetical protein
LDKVIRSQAVLIAIGINCLATNFVFSPAQERAQPRAL